MPNKKIDKDQKLYRSGVFLRDSASEESRTIEISFSSETPVLRYFGYEILDHNPESIRLGRLNDGGPLLVDHDTGVQVGVVEKAFIGDGRKGRALVRFGSSARAMEESQDVRDGIRRNVSVSYRIHKAVLEKTDKGVETYRVTDWEPLEISLVSVPADTTVGVGRSDQSIESTPQTEQEIKMPPEEDKKKETRQEPSVNIEDIRARSTEDARKGELARIKEIQAIADQFGHLSYAKEMARQALTDGVTVDQFRATLLHKMAGEKPTSQIGITSKESKRYSLVRALNAMASGDWRGAEFERECSEAVALKLKRSPGGIFVPHEIQSRDLQAGTPSAGGDLVGTNLQAGSFIEMLRNRMRVRELGATILSNLVGDIAIPRQTGGATAYWVGESTDPTESEPVVGQIKMAPKTIGAFTDMSRKLLMQSSIDVEGFVQRDLATVLALGMDLSAIKGSGTSHQPKGVLNYTGIGSVAGGTNGLAPTWAHMVNLETEVAIDNADVGSLGYLTNAKVRGKLKQTEKASNTAQFVWENGGQPGSGMMNGYRAEVSNQVPSNLDKGSSTGVCSAIIFGNWADLVIALWGGLDVLVDPYTGGNNGTVRVRVLQDSDIALRHVESFAAMLDALTA